MDFAEKKRKVEHLLRVKFPFSWAPPPIETLRGPQTPLELHELHKRLMIKVEGERASLMAKPDSEVEQLFSAAGTEEQAKAAMRAGIEEKGRFFSRREADADFSYWSKVEYWSLDESVALLLGKSSEVVTWKAIQAYVNISAFAKQYERLRNLAMRAQAMNRGQSAAYPSAVLAWANEMDIPVPHDLQAALARRWEKGQAAALAEAPQVVLTEPGENAATNSSKADSSSAGSTQVPSTDTASAVTPSAGPSLSTDQICDAFAGVGMNSLQWRTALTKNRPKWLMACVASRGRTGANPVQGRWYPLKIAVALVEGQSRMTVPVAKLDVAFRRNQVLRPFAEDWDALRGDYQAWGE